jgi:hypothetical protein
MGMADLLELGIREIEHQKRQVVGEFLAATHLGSQPCEAVDEG